MSESKTPRPTPRLKELHKADIVPAMMKEFGYSNVMQVPTVKKISVNIGKERIK